MDALRISGYGGVAGRVLRETFSMASLGTGLVLGLVLWITAWTLQKAGATGVEGPLFHILWALALARFAVNGLYGEWRGSIFSASGGSTGAVAPVAGRYLALTAAWVVPLMLLRIGPDSAAAGVGGALLGMPDTKAVSLGLLYLTATALTPPLFLIVAVGAYRFTDIVSPEHWRRLFAGRGGDLVLVYSLYLGAVTGLVALLLPLVAAVMLQSRGWGTFLGLVGLVYAMGFAVTLLGRLCGFFVGFDPREEAEGIDAVPSGETSGDPRPGPVLRPAPSPEAPGIGASAEEAPRLRMVTSHPPQTPSGKPPLMEARDRVRAFADRFEEDAEGALAGLEELRRDFAAHPLVLHALCLLRRKAGDEEKAMETAREGIPLFFERGNYRLAAEVFHVLQHRSEELELPRDQLLEIASQLRSMHQYGTASRAYAILLQRDAFETRAVKGMLQLGEVHLHHTGEPEEARKLYRFLLDRCGTSPLADFMRQGLEEAEKRLAG